MPSVYDVQIGQRFSFEVYATSVLGNNFQDVRLEGIISAQTALSYGFDIQSFHANIYPSLPPGQVADDPFDYPYIRFQFPSGEYAVMGTTWIRPETIVISAGRRYTFTFEDKTQSDIDRMLMALSSNGYRPDAIRAEA